VFLYLRSLFFPGTPLAAQYDAVFFFEHAKRIVLGQIPIRYFFVFVMPGTDVLYARGSSASLGCMPGSLRPSLFCSAPNSFHSFLLDSMALRRAYSFRRRRFSAITIRRSELRF